MFHVPEMFRTTTGAMASDASYGNCGMFIIPAQLNGNKIYFVTIAAEANGWEHVSVTVRDKDFKPIPRNPAWKEMCNIKKDILGCGGHRYTVPPGGKRVRERPRGMPAPVEADGRSTANTTQGYDRVT